MSTMRAKRKPEMIGAHPKNNAVFTTRKRPQTYADARAARDQGGGLPMNTNDTKPGDLVRECYNGWPGRPAHLSSLVWCVLKTHDDGVVAEMHPNTKIFVWLKSWIRVSGK